MMDEQNGQGQVALTAEERRFIVSCLENVSLQGKAAGLRPVLAMIERIVARLAVEEETAGAPAEEAEE